MIQVLLKEYLLLVNGQFSKVSKHAVKVGIPTEGCLSQSDVYIWGGVAGLKILYDLWIFKIGYEAGTLGARGIFFNLPCP